MLFYNICFQEFETLRDDTMKKITKSHQDLDRNLLQSIIGSYKDQQAQLLKKRMAEVCRTDDSLMQKLKERMNKKDKV